MSIAQSEEFVQ
jgi:hypothetical protein